MPDSIKCFWHITEHNARKHIIIKGLVLSDTKRLDIWYVASTSGTLPSLFKLWFCGPNGIILEVTEFMRLLFFFDSTSFISKLKFLPNFDTTASLWRSNSADPRNFNIFLYHSYYHFQFYWWSMVNFRYFCSTIYDENLTCLRTRVDCKFGDCVLHIIYLESISRRFGYRPKYQPETPLSARGLIIGQGLILIAINKTLCYNLFISYSSLLF